MCVKFFGREVPANATPTEAGYFLKCEMTVGLGLQVGSLIEVDGISCRVRHLIQGSAGEPEVWALLVKASG